MCVCVCVCRLKKERYESMTLSTDIMATKNIHPNCGPCALYGKTKLHYSHPCEWNLVSQQNFVKIMCSDITMTSCICKAFILDIKRNLTNPTYRPRREKVKPSCKVPGCKNGNLKLLNRRHHCHNTAFAAKTTDRRDHLMYRSL